jgi:hypothetical protein
VSIFFGGICLAIPAWIIANGALAIANSYPNHPDISKAKAAKVISIIVTILTVLGVIFAGVLFVWANSLANDMSNDYSSSFYSATDHSDSVSASADNLVTLNLISSNQDLNFAFVDITLEVDGNWYTCSVGESDGCSITQQSGTNDAVWEVGENIVLSENTQEICSNSDCNINLNVRYRGSPLNGQQSITIS